jgi:FKBP-type peptidyl-prolyl cis-trans isomerase 2
MLRKTLQAPAPRVALPNSLPTERYDMSQIKEGDKVRIHYKGTLTDGTVFDSSEGRDPLEFTVGSGEIIPGLDKALPGMAVGDEKRVEVSVMEGYGPRHEDRMIEVPLSELPEDIPREVGLMLAMRSPEGQDMPVKVTAVSDTTMTLDANHQLAGEELIFEIEIVSIG